MPLAYARLGEPTVIRKISGKDETKRFLENLGFTVGSEITILNEMGGHVIVCVKDSRVAIDKAMAMRIIV